MEVWRVPQSARVFCRRVQCSTTKSKRHTLCMAPTYRNSNARNGSGDVSLLRASQMGAESQPNTMMRLPQEAPCIMTQAKIAKSSTYGTCTFEASGRQPQKNAPSEASVTCQ